MGGGSQKVTSDDEGEGGGVRIPPKIDDVIYEQPLTDKRTDTQITDKLLDSNTEIQILNPVACCPDSRTI